MMRPAPATDPGTPGRLNEDWAGATSSAVVVLDGVTVPAELGTGCTHGTPWYVHQLGARLLAAADSAPRSPLANLLADAIEAVATLHRGTCDLSHLGTPSAAVAVLREQAEAMDYLVLADVSIVLDGPAGVSVVTDTRAEQSRRALDPGDTAEERVAGIAEHRRRFRNRPGGYWVAADDPGAAAEAVVGSVRRADVRRAAVLTDGAACIVHPYEVMGWGQALDLMDDEGPQALIGRVRQAERVDPDGVRWPRYKAGDDATAVWCGLSS